MYYCTNSILLFINRNRPNSLNAVIFREFLSMCNKSSTLYSPCHFRSARTLQHEGPVGPHVPLARLHPSALHVKIGYINLKFISDSSSYVREIHAIKYFPLLEARGGDSLYNVDKTDTCSICDSGI